MALQWNAVATGNRLETAARARQALAAAGAWILDHHTFSNLSLSISFEIRPAALPRLMADLDAAGISLTRSSRAQPAEPDPETGLAPASLQITFIHDEPDLRDIVPAVPG